MRRTKHLAVTVVAAFALAAIAAAPALASSSPSVETKPATSITDTTAVLNGTVNPEGAKTDYYFQYGPTTSYGSKTEELSAGSGTTKLAENQMISGLTPSTTYHFRIVASNSNGTSLGADQQFKTVPKGLPEFELATGEKFPVTLEGSFPSATSTFFTEGKANIFLGGCSGVNASGSITGAKALSLTLALIGCAAHGEECKTAGASKAGEEVFSGTGTLVYISKAKKELSVLWELKETEILCRSLEIEAEVRGSILIPLTPVNTKTSKVDLRIRTNEKHRQEVTEYENEKGELKKAKLEIETLANWEESAINIVTELDLTASKSLTASA